MRRSLDISKVWRENLTSTTPKICSKWFRISQATKAWAPPLCVRIHWQMIFDGHFDLLNKESAVKTTPPLEEQPSHCPRGWQKNSAESEWVCVLKLCALGFVNMLFLEFVLTLWTNLDLPQVMRKHKWWRPGCLTKCKHTLITKCTAYFIKNKLK